MGGYDNDSFSIVFEESKSKNSPTIYANDVNIKVKYSNPIYGNTGNIFTSKNRSTDREDTFRSKPPLFSDDEDDSTSINNNNNNKAAFYYNSSSSGTYDNENKGTNRHEKTDTNIHPTTQADTHTDSFNANSFDFLRRRINVVNNKNNNNNDNNNNNTNNNNKMNSSDSSSNSIVFSKLYSRSSSSLPLPSTENNNNKNKNKNYQVYYNEVFESDGFDNNNKNNNNNTPANTSTTTNNYNNIKNKKKKNKQKIYFYIQMQLCKRESLSHWLTSEPFDLDITLRIFAQIVNGMAYVHQLSLMHRDLKVLWCFCFLFYCFFLIY